MGREADLVALGQLLAQHQLVTIIGAGGVGKTRLALELAQRQLAQGGDVCLVTLAKLHDATLLPNLIAYTLGLSDKHAGDQVQQIEAMLQERALLLVLDNCEHLNAAVAALCQRLLAACPSLTILVTSREGLHLPAEAS